MPVTFLVGGARSGKSRFAVELGRQHESGGGRVRFVATAPHLDDGDWIERIERHRAERPAWPTIEEPVELAAVLRSAAGADELVIVDCLTLWVSNLSLRGDGDAELLAATDELIEAASDRPGPTVVVSNEVGLGIHPDSALGRRFRDLLGSVNQRVAASSSTALFFVGGRAMALHDPWQLVR